MSGRLHTLAILALFLLGIALVAPGGPAAAEGSATEPGPPSTTIRFGPEGWTNLTRPVFGYESDDPDASFECRLDSEPFEFCGPATYEVLEGHRGAKLSEGTHTVEVRAGDPDGQVDPTPARVVLMVDTHPPSAAVVSGPTGFTHQRRPKFGLRVAGEDSFRCLITGKNVRIKVRSCDGPHSFRPPRPLGEGTYEIVVVASDQAGNETEDRVEFSVRTDPGPPPPPPNPYRRSVLYSGGGKGVRVRFRLRGSELLEARVVLNLACVSQRHGKRRLHRRRYVVERASPRFPIQVNERGRFQAFEPEPSVWEDWFERLGGQVTPRSIVGKATVSFSEHAPESTISETCQTERRRPAQPAELHFDARRRRSRP